MRSRLHALLPLGLILAALGIVLVRPYDGAAFRGVGTGTGWSQHQIRLEGLLKTFDGQPLSGMSLLYALDSQYPPLLHRVTITLSPLLGHSAEGVSRGMVIWWLLLGLSVTAVAHLWTGSRRFGLTAGLGTFLVPVFGASSLHYYFDLPLAALTWTCVAFVLGARRLIESNKMNLGAGITLALAGGCCFTLAALMKWSALPQATPLVLGALVTPLREPGGGPLSTTRRRLLSMTLVGLAVGLVALLSVQSYLQGSSASWDEMQRITLSPGPGHYPPIAELHPSLQSFHIPALGKLQTYAALVPGRIYSPILTLLVIFGLALWMRRGAPGWDWGLLGVGGNLSFLLFLIPPTDERFLYLVAPLPVMLALKGLDETWPRLQPAVVVVWSSVSLGVLADAHHGEDSPLSRPWEVSFVQDTVGRGLGISSGDPAAGWRRADAPLSRPHFDLQHEALFEEIILCKADSLTVSPEALVDPSDETWWRYRTDLAQVRQESRSRDPERQMRLRQGQDLVDALARSDAEFPTPIGLLSEDELGLILLPAHLQLGVSTGWRKLSNRTLGGRVEVSLWASPGLEDCRP